jgi:hypothetical protein
MKSALSVVIEEGEKKCFCKNCNVFHPCTEHFVNAKTNNGYSYNCKATTKNYYAPPQKFTQAEIVQKETNRILKSLGYDLSSPIPIHQQFLLKHDL